MNTVNELHPPARIITAGFIRNQPLHSTPGTKEEDTMLTLVFEGRGSYRNQQSHITVLPAMVGIVPPRDRGILMSDRAHPYHHFYCRFTGEFSTHLCGRILAENNQRFFFTHQMYHLQALARRIGVLNYARDRDFGVPDAVLLELLCTLSRTPLPGSATRLSQPQLETYLTDHMADPFDCPTWARYFGVSETTLWRRVKAFTGLPPAQYAESKKVEWAKSLLQHGDLRIQEVSVRVGYSDPFYFSRVFKKHTGLSPSEFRAKGRF